MMRNLDDEQSGFIGQNSSGRPDTIRPPLGGTVTSPAFLQYKPDGVRPAVKPGPTAVSNPTPQLMIAPPAGPAAGPTPLKNPRGTSSGGAGGPSGPGTAGDAPVFAQQPTIQPPPPAAPPPPPPTSTLAPPPAPALPTTGAQQPSTSDSYQSLLNKTLQNPSRFDLDAVKSSYDFLKGDLQQEADKSRAEAITDAQKRGVYYGTPLTAGLGLADKNYNRGLGNLATQLMLQQAQTQGEDTQRALSQGLQFGQAQQAGDQFKADLGLRSAGLGYQGAPDISSTLAQLGGLPILGGQGNDLGGLGALLGLLGKGG